MFITSSQSSESPIQNFEHPCWLCKPFQTAGGAEDPTIEEDCPDDEEDDLSEECSEENEDGDTVEGEVIAPSLPKFSMGDLFNSAPIKPKAAAKRRGKANAKEEDTDSMLGEETGTMSEVDLLRELEGDMELKQVNKSLDRNYSCLVGLIPSKILAGNMRVGHQIKGVPGLQLHLLRHFDTDISSHPIDLIFQSGQNLTCHGKPQTVRSESDIDIDTVGPFDDDSIAIVMSCQSQINKNVIYSIYLYMTYIYIY